MRLLVAMLALFVVFAPLAPSALADGGDSGNGDDDGDTVQRGCRISTADPTKPAIYGDCIIWGSGVGVGDTMSADGTWAAAEVALVTPATVDCDALCDRMIQVGLTVETHDDGTAPVDASDGIQAPLGAYVTANLEAPQGEAEAGSDEGGFFASTILTPFERA